LPGKHRIQIDASLKADNWIKGDKLQGADETGSFHKTVFLEVHEGMVTPARLSVEKVLIRDSAIGTGITEQPHGLPKSLVITVEFGSPLPYDRAEKMSYFINGNSDAGKMR
jgi:hypothetical protein